MEDWWKKNLNGIKSFYLFFFIIILLVFFVYLVFAESPGLVRSNQWEGNLNGTKFSSSIFGDIDNDGDLDLAMMGCVDATGTTCEGASDDSIFRIYINNGSSLLENTTWQQNLIVINTGSIAFGDVDNDGDLDIMATGCHLGGGDTVVDCNSWNSTIYINNGTSFVNDSAWRKNLSDVWNGAVAFGDVDNDGDLDLLMTGLNLGVYFVMIYTNNGTSFLENTTEILKEEHKLEKEVKKLKGKR